MAYKFFTERLLNSDVDFSQIFPKKQEESKKRGNVSYGLGDIILHLKDETQNFTKWTREYEDMDVAIRRIVEKYYEIEKIPNPFEDKGKKKLETFVSNSLPKEGIVIKDGKGTGKGVVKPASAIDEVAEVIEPVDVAEVAPVAVAEVAEEPVVVAPSSIQIEAANETKIQEFKKQIENIQFMYDDETVQSERDSIILGQKKRVSNYEMLLEDEPDELLEAKLSLLKEFISKNS